MEPPVISSCELESQLIILEIVFAHIDIKTVTGYVVERFGFRLGFLAFLVGVVTFDIAVLGELFLDLGKVTFRSGNIQSIGDGFQMGDLTFRICDLLCDSFFGTLQLSVFIKIFFGILCRSQRRIKWNGDLLVGIIVQSLKRFAALLKPVSVGVDQFAVNFEFIFLGSIVQLFFLDVIFFSVTFQSSLYYATKIGRFLVDPCQQTLGSIISLQHGRNTVKSFAAVFTAKLLIRKDTVFHRFFSAVDNIRSELSVLDLFHQAEEGVVKMGAGRLIQRLCRITSVNRCTVADLLSHYRAHTGEGSIKGFGNVYRFFADMSGKFFLGNCQRIFFIPGIWNEIFSSWKDFTDRTHMGRDMFDTVQDHTFFIAEDDVAVFAHQLHDQALPAGVAKFIEVLQLKFHHTLHSRLFYIQDSGASDMLSKKHTEVWCS